MSFVGIILLGVGSNQTLKMLVRTKRYLLQHNPTLSSSRITFDSLGYYAFGHTGYQIATCAQVITNLGIVCGYAIFVGDTLLRVAEICGVSRTTMDPELYPGGLHVSLFLVASFPLLAGLALLKSMRKLAPVSLVGTVAIVIASFAVFYSSAVEISNNGIMSVPSARWETFPTFFGLLVFGFAIHGVALPIDEGMEHPEQMELILNVASFIVVVIYLAFSVLCYAAYGDTVHASILDNLPEVSLFDKVLKVSTGILLSVSMLLTIPLFFFSVFRTLERGDEGGESGSESDSGSRLAPVTNKEDDGGTANTLEQTLLPARSVLFHGSGLLSPPPAFVKTPAAVQQSLLQQDRGGSAATGGSGSSWYRTSCNRILTVGGTIVVAILLGPLFSEVISLVGAFSMSLVAFILPATFYLKIVSPELSVIEKGCGWLLLIFGVVALCVSTWQSVNSMVYFFSHDHHEKLCGAQAVAPSPFPNGTEWSR